MAKRWDPNNPENIDPALIDEMSDEELAKWDDDCNKYNENR